MLLKSLFHKRTYLIAYMPCKFPPQVPFEKRQESCKSLRYPCLLSPRTRCCQTRSLRNRSLMAHAELHRAMEADFLGGASSVGEYTCSIDMIALGRKWFWPANLVADKPRPSAGPKTHSQALTTTSKKRKIDASQRKITNFFRSDKDDRQPLQPSSYLNNMSAAENISSQMPSSTREPPAPVGLSSLSSSPTLEATGSDESSEDEHLIRPLESTWQNIEDSLFETSGPGSEHMALQVIGEASYHINNCLL